MNKSILLIGFLLAVLVAQAQPTQPKTSISLQTDLLGYTTKGGYDVWGVLRHDQYQLALAFVNYPNRDKSYYGQSGLKENDQFVRLGLTRYWNKKKWKALFYGVHLEYHWRELLEDGSSERLTDRHIAFAPVIGYHWFPFKQGGLRRFSAMIWAGPRLRPYFYKQDRVFEQTGSVYPSPSFVDLSLGLHIGYQLFNR
ncbi:hypothetical protein [Spirosoma linguale]|uniref:DUF3575 domain-containing protein n=1 Tax=Spirosoma linguale (strain ATCC 33905 / DSM 74 / LMG 10896 / Claus 1) TaxID=504472 RepID=D2QBZ0_SPILD|nr:hypothetical protein Slin_3724 [Spirosoma linguale DSM 74]